MKTILFNVAWLIIVSLFSANAYSQLTIDPNNIVELKINCDELYEIPLPIIISDCQGDIKSSFEDKLYSGGCYGTIERIWTFRDQCDHVITYQQFIHLVDTTAPHFSEYPENITVSISEIPVAEVLTANDNCDKNISVEFNETQNLDENEKLISILRTWSTKDKCGNNSSHSQLIKIEYDQP